MKKNAIKLLALSLISAMALSACAAPSAKSELPQNAQEAPADQAEVLRFEDCFLREVNSFALYKLKNKILREILQEIP